MGTLPKCSRDGVVVGVDVVDGEPTDGRGSLGVEQEQQPGDSVVGVEVVVV